MPAPDSGDDAIGIGGPDEGFGIMVGLGDEAVDGLLQFNGGAEHAAFEALLAEFGKEAFDGIEPGGGCRCEVESPAWMAFELGRHLWMFVGGVIVDNGVNVFAGWYLTFDLVEKADEFLVPVVLHVLTDDLALVHVEGRKQRCRAMPLVVVGHRAGPPLLHGQARLGPVQRLDLAFLVDRQHNDMCRRFDIETDNIAQLLNELRVFGQLEAACTVRLQAVRPPDALHGAGRDAGHLGHGPRGPVGDLARRRFRSRMIASSRTRSSGLTSRVMPVRTHPIRTLRAARESKNGFLC